MRITQRIPPTDRTFPLILVLLLLASASLFAGGASEQDGGANPSADVAGEDVDYVAVAALLIRDGNYDRAEQALSNVDPTADGVDLARYYTLLGLLQLRTGDYQASAGAFREAIRNGQEDSSIYAYLAQSENALGNHQAALEALSEVPNLTRFPGLFSLKASSEWELGRAAEALTTLRRAGELYASRSDFARQRIAYLLELDLTQAAAEESLNYLQDAEQSPEVYTAMGEALRRGGQLEAAVQVLELGRIRFQENEQIKLVLAQTYLDRDMPRTAGYMIEEAAARNLSLYHEAAEIYRRAGDLSRALFLNSLVLDPAKKTRQRFNLLLAQERYEEAVALEPRLAAGGATEDDGVRYALAYAFFENRALDRAVEYLSEISSAEYFQQATQLRRAVETVRDREYIYF